MRSSYKICSFCFSDPFVVRACAASLVPVYLFLAKRAFYSLSLSFWPNQIDPRDQ